MLPRTEVRFCGYCGRAMNQPTGTAQTARGARPAPVRSALECGNPRCGAFHIPI